MDTLRGDTCSYVCPETWLNYISPDKLSSVPNYGLFNENITWAFLCLSLPVGFFKNSGIVIVFSWLFQKLATLQYFAGLRWPTVERQIFWIILFNTEDKRKNGESQDIICVLLSGLILKTWVCCHLCPKSGLICENSPCCYLCPESGLN